jgi:nucleoside-diphosphate-sugar epimerase
VDAVVHLAGMRTLGRPVEAYQAVNVAGTENVCRAALQARVGRVVHVSSWMAYGMNLGQPAREEFLLRPVPEPYAVTKAAGDLAVQRMIVNDHLPGVIIRPGMIFGPGDRLHFGRIADRLRAAKGHIVGSGTNALPLVYVTDVVKGLLLALDHDQAVGQAYNIGNDLPLTQRQVLDAIALEIGAPRARLRVPYRVQYGASCLAEWVASLIRAENPVITPHGVRLFGGDNRLAIDKARCELGYRPDVPLHEGIRLAAAWYRSQHQLEPSPQRKLTVGSEVEVR